MMTYFRTRMRMLRAEYTKPDRRAVIVSAGDKCTMCGRENGDEFLFGPTAYLKKKIRFKVYIDIHVIEGGPAGRRTVVMCCGCHMSYHLFNRLSENAEFGVPIEKTIYKRCRKCHDLKDSCRCCAKCGKAPKWCGCRKRKPVA